MKQLETERKFRVDPDRWRTLEKPAATPYLQGYLSIDSQKVVRVRVAGERGYITIKGRSEGIQHPEYEYEIPGGEARELIMAYATGTVTKERYRIPVGSHLWEVDVFSGANDGLIVAEIELQREDEVFERPSWLADEVTHDPRYYNAMLSQHPFGDWKNEDPPAD